MSASSWYVAKGKTKHGPYSREQLKQQARSGQPQAGGPNVVLTNGHVLGMLCPEGRQPQEIEVVVSKRPGSGPIALQIDRLTR